MSDTELHSVQWLMTFAFGLPILAIVIWKRWRQAQTAFLWRAIACVTAACVFAPGVVIEDFDGIATVDVFPAVLAMALAPVQALTGEPGVLAAGVRYGILPILIVSLVFISIWSMIIRVKREVAK